MGANFTYTFPRVNLYGILNFTHRQNYDVLGYEYSNLGDVTIKSNAIDDFPEPTFPKIPNNPASVNSEKSIVWRS